MGEFRIQNGKINLNFSHSRIEKRDTTRPIPILFVTILLKIGSKVE